MAESELDAFDDSPVEHIRLGMVLRRKILKLLESYPKSVMETWEILNQEKPLSKYSVGRHFRTLLSEEKIKVYEVRGRNLGHKYIKNHLPGSVEIMKVIYSVAVTGDSLQRCDEAAQWMRNEVC
jgi:hypothetical protein